MDAFRTEINITRRPFIDYGTRILTTGSCFADNLGAIMKMNKFQVMTNPFGVAYNPLSIHRLLSYAIARNKPAADGFIERDGYWFHFGFHSQWTSDSRELLEQNLSQALSGTGEWIRSTNTIVLTYGTAWVYKHKESGNIVSNCHKIPSAAFEKRLLTVDEIVNDFNGTYRQVRSINPKVRVILTVSPVRHVRDTLEGNQTSKSVIRLACHHIATTHPDVVYFPAYEIVLDDLRDYRFYEADLIHPSLVAQEYIWEKFCNAYVTDDALALLERWTSLRKAINHRAFQPGSPSHQKFLSETLSKLKDISAHLDVSGEIESFTNANRA